MSLFLFILGLTLGAILALCVMLWAVLTTRQHRLENINGVRAVELAAAAIAHQINGGQLAYSSFDAFYRGVALAALRAAWPELARPYLRGYLVTGRKSQMTEAAAPVRQTSPS